MTLKLKNWDAFLRDLGWLERLDDNLVNSPVGCGVALAPHPRKLAV
ncbi:hypothetical protein [Sinorhizobium sp. RAC02]|nr:hypothetical protein [Sinorhizobium sp. RAC02]